jgi:putative ABC transport system substrate-binding protein
MRRTSRFLRRRRAILAALAAVPWFARADSTPRRRRVALFSGLSLAEVRADYEATYAKEFAEFGWVEGRTMEVLLFFNDYDQKSIDAQARKCVEARPDAIITGSTARTLALRRQTSAIPIVTTVGDPVGSGFAKSLGRPGGNITGLSFATLELYEKRAEILRLALPALRAVSIVDAVANIDPGVWPLRRMLQAGFRAQRIEPTFHAVASLDELRTVLRGLPRSGRGAAFIGTLFDLLHDREVTQAAIDLRVPMMVPDAEDVAAGAMLAYQTFHDHQIRRIVTIVDKVLRGTDPATIPFELPDRSRLSVNLRTARAIGISLARDFLLRADTVIE